MGRINITVGLLGGSFNPAHAGHLYISLAALKGLKLNQVWWLVSPQNPLKAANLTLSLEKRMAIAQKLARHPRINVTDIEKNLPSYYTYHTIRYLKRRFPAMRFVWLMGADNLVQFPKWYKWQEIAKLIPIIVYDRGEDAYKGLAGKMASRYRKYRINGRNILHISTHHPPVWGYIRIAKHPLSSTEIRNNQPL